MAKKPPKPADRPSQPRSKSKRKKSGLGLLGGFAFMPPFVSAEAPRPPTLSLSDLSKWPSLEEQMAHYEEASKELREGTDRAVAIVGALYVQDALNGLIVVHLARTDETTMGELYNRDGPLHSFGTATLLAYAMGLIEQSTKTRLDTIRRVRNAFAHAFRPITFETPAIADACRGLLYKPAPDIAAILEDMGKALHYNAKYQFLQTVFSESRALSAKSLEKAKEVLKVLKEAQSQRPGEIPPT
jgi:hypothetical protein